MLDNIREWISDNLRYILLGIAGVLLLVIAFFAVRLVSGLGKPKEKTPQTENMTEASTEAAPTADGEQTLVADQEDVLAWATQFYTARAQKDYDTLAGLCETFDESTQADLEAHDVLVEAYNNIKTYSKPGMTEGSYVVYVYFDAKLKDVTTLAPNIRELYLITNTEGKLVWADEDPEQTSWIEELRTDADVQALINDVQQQYEKAIESDEELKNLLASGGDSGEGTDSGTADASGDSTPVTGTQTGTMQTTTTINVRGETSADSTLYGTLTEGTQVEVLENLDNGWSKIRYVTNGTTIEGYVMAQYLTSVQ